jgi:hypothetical protein
VTIRRLVIAVAFLGILFMAVRPMIDSDTWWHLRTGEWIVENHALPRVDPFSLTRNGEPWYYPGWLSEILMVKVFGWGGLPALNVLFTGIILLSFVLIYSTMDGNAFLLSAVLVLAAGASEIYWSARPQLFTFLFGAAFYLVLRKFLWGTKNALWLLPLLMAVWVNVHPGFAVGFILLLIAVVGQGVYFLSRREFRTREDGRKLAWLAGIFPACLAAAAFNPRGITVLAYPFRTVSIQFLQNYIQEWQAPNFHNLDAQLFLILLFLAWTAIAFSPRDVDMRDFSFLVFIGYMGFLAWRNTNLLSIIAPAVIMQYGNPIVEKYLPGWNVDHVVSRLQSAVHIILTTCLTAGVLLVGIASVSPDSIQAVVRRQISVNAVEYLAAHPIQGNLLNSYNFGSYLLWHLPSVPVFVDGRTDLYDDAILGQYLTVVRAQAGWRDVLEQWHIRAVFLEPSAPILQILRTEGWTVYFEDPQAVILLHPDS